MIGFRKIYPSDTEIWARVERLYADAFPRNERRAESEMRRLAECGRLNVFAAVDAVGDTAVDATAAATVDTVVAASVDNVPDADNDVAVAAAVVDTDGKIDFGGAFRGFITWWDFGEFVYGEHFAMLPECRGAGIGGEAIDRFVAEAGRPVILEVELPTDEMSRRRIGFYERHGFALCDAEYVQPPYDAGGEGVPMRLMSHGVTLDAAMFARVRDTLYAEVYGNR